MQVLKLSDNYSEILSTPDSNFILTLQKNWYRLGLSRFAHCTTGIFRCGFTMKADGKIHRL